MTETRHREEVANALFALVLSELGIDADAETIRNGGRHRPDVMFTYRGLRVVMEAKYDDAPDAEGSALRDAYNRIRAGIAHIAAAVLYPKRLRGAATNELRAGLRKAKLRYCILAEDSRSTGGKEEDAWYEGTVRDLVEALKRSQGALAGDDLVKETADRLRTHLSQVSDLWKDNHRACDRLSKILGFPDTEEEKPKARAARRATAAQVSALVLANALIFQQQLTRQGNPTGPRKKIKTLRSMMGSETLVDDLLEQWQHIRENINYAAIFSLGERVLRVLPTDDPQMPRAMKSLVKGAQDVCDRQAALRHDLMGRIYHLLLHEAKHLGAYYTSVPAATLLLKLALSADWKQDFSEAEALKKFRVGDLACGTGTLLMASAQALSDAHVRSRFESDKPIAEENLRDLHKILMESILHGYDVLPSAVHLTASTLALLAPEVAFSKMNLYAMPLESGPAGARLGSLDFFSAEPVRTQMLLDASEAKTIRADAAGEHVMSEVAAPKFHLLVMNPPFVRSVGGNLLFGNLPMKERKKLQEDLKSLVRKNGIPAHITAGLGSVFVALADKHLEEGGRLAFVLPLALASGEAWGKTRDLLARKYHLEMVVSSWDSLRYNFTENTKLSETLFIARKLRQSGKGAKEEAGRTTYITLRRNPTSIHGALHLAHEIRHKAPRVASVGGAGDAWVDVAGEHMGEMISMPPARGKEIWTGALFAQTELLRTCCALQRGGLLLPGTREEIPLPVCPLGELGLLGYDQRDIHDAFKHREKDFSAYPSFWNHDHTQVRTISAKPNSWLHPRSKPKKGRKLKSAEAVWSKADRLLLAERLWPITQSVLAVGFKKPVLGNTWWAVDTSAMEDTQVKALLLYLNSSLCISQFFSRRVVTRSAFFKMKKPAWTSMPVLDVRRLKPAQLKRLATAHDSLASKHLLPIAELNADDVRKSIDAALCGTLGLPPLDPLRELLAREPGLTDQRL